MSVTAKSDDSDCQLNTLTGLVGIVGETRSDVKVLDRKVEVLDRKVEVLDRKVEVLDRKVEVLDRKVEVLDRKVEVLDHKVDVVDSKIDRHHKEFSEFKQESRERFDKIEDTLAIIVNHLKN